MNEKSFSEDERKRARRRCAENEAEKCVQNGCVREVSYV